jgi:hypothetical protein
MRCNLLIEALREDGAKDGPTPSKAHEDALSNAQESVLFNCAATADVYSKLALYYSILYIVRERVERWATMDTVRSLLHQGDIREGVDELHRRVDTCIEACHVHPFPSNCVPFLIFRISVRQVRISRELAQAQTEHTLAAQRDNSEIREMILELRASFTQYIHNREVPNNETFQTVYQDIQEVCLSTGLRHDNYHLSTRKLVKFRPLPPCTRTRTTYQKYVPS